MEKCIKLVTSDTLLRALPALPASMASMTPGAVDSGAEATAVPASTHAAAAATDATDAAALGGTKGSNTAGQSCQWYVPLDITPLLCNGTNIDFVYLIGTMPGRHSGDQVHKVKQVAAPSFDILLR